MQPEVTSDDHDRRVPSGEETRAGGRVRLRSDLRAALPDAGAAVVVTGAVFVFLYLRMRSGTSATVAVMPFMDDPNTFWMYLLSQAFGWSGLLWAWGTVVLGLVLSRATRGRLPVSRSVLERWHRTTSLTTMALMAAHALMFVAELVRYETELGWAAHRAGPAGRRRWDGPCVRWGGWPRPPSWWGLPAVVLSGHDGGRARPVAPPDTAPHVQEQD